MKITIDDIKAQFASTNSINQRFGQVSTEFNDKVLYRDNPVGEPNDMKNDLDMGVNSIVNVDTIFAKELIIDGVSLGGDLVWGAIVGNLEDQIDLWNYLQGQDEQIALNRSDINTLAVTVALVNVKADDNSQRLDVVEQDLQSNVIREVRISPFNDTPISLVVDNTEPSIPEIGLTSVVGTKNPYTLVKTNQNGLIPNEVLPLTGAFNLKGIFTTAADPGPYDNPDSRGLGPFFQGDLYVVDFPAPQTTGTIPVINPDTDLLEDTLFNPGDQLLYLEANIPNGIVQGWYQAKSQSSAGDASAIAYNDAGNSYVIGVNVQLALDNTDLALINLHTYPQEEIQDVLAGVNPIITLALPVVATVGPLATPTHFVYRNGLLQREGASYTVTGAQEITFVAPYLEEGDFLSIVYTGN